MAEEPVYEVPAEPESEPETLPPMDYDGPEPEPLEPAPTNNNKTILIIVAVIAGLILLCCCVVFVILPLLGGPIEEIFEEIIEGMESSALSFYI